MSEDVYLCLSVKGGEKPVSFPLKRNAPVRIGSSLVNDILINSPEISPQHAEVLPSLEGFVLREPDANREQKLVPGPGLEMGILTVSLKSEKSPAPCPAQEKIPGKSSFVKLRLTLLALIGLALAFLLFYPSPLPRTTPSIREEAGPEPKNQAASPFGDYLSLPPEQRISRARESLALGEQRLRDRRISTGNLSLAKAEFRKALDLLGGLEPAPDLRATLESRLRETEDLLDEEFRRRKFSAEQAIRFQDPDRAELELKNILELINVPDDPRYRYAQERLKAIGRAE